MALTKSADARSQRVAVLHKRLAVPIQFGQRPPGHAPTDRRVSVIDAERSREIPQRLLRRGKRLLLRAAHFS